MSDTIKPFATLAFEFSTAKSMFEEALTEAGIEFEKIRWDYYDESLELDDVPNNLRLTEDQQKVIRDAGFAKCYVNHCDGWETHYNFGGNNPFPDRGWRRLRREGGFDVSYWPEGWKGLDWLETTGYVKVVPDELDPVV